MKYSEEYKFYETQLTPLSKVLRVQMTPAEKRFWQAVRRRSVEGCLFLRQKPILSYIADFYCAELLLIIEIDGSSHDNKKEMDLYRTGELKAYGYTVIRYTNEQVISSLPRVMRHLTKIIRLLKERHPSLTREGLGEDSNRSL